MFENGVEQPIKIFRREDVPISLGIIIDNSGSMREKRQKVESASLDLVRASNPQDEVFIVNFNDDAYLDVPITSDIKKMEEGIARIDSRGGTAMRDAISMSMDYVKKEGHRQKKVLLVITDGNDNASNISLEKLVGRAQQSEVLIYCIGLLNEEERREARLAKRALDAISRDSGGVAFYPKSPAEVDAIALAGGARNPQSIHHRLLADRSADGRQLPPDQSHGERARPSGGPNADRLLRHARCAGQENSEPTALMLPFLWRAAEDIDSVPGAAPTCAGAWKPTGACLPTKSDFDDFWRFVWEHRRDLSRFLAWADRMQ